MTEKINISNTAPLKKTSNLKLPLYFIILLSFLSAMGLLFYYYSNQTKQTVVSPIGNLMVEPTQIKAIKTEKKEVIGFLPSWEIPKKLLSVDIKATPFLSIK